MVIERYLDTKRFERVKRDLPPLVGLINRSGGEYSLQLRENYFNIYYQGNSLARVKPNKNGTYSAEIHRRFLRDDILERLERYSKKTTRKSSNYASLSAAGSFSTNKREQFHLILGNLTFGLVTAHPLLSIPAKKRNC